MKAAVLVAPNIIDVTDVPDPEAGAGEVVIDVAACGICGTDLHTIAGDNVMVRYPAITGHEFVGRVRRVGAGCQRLDVGTRVAVDPSRFCGRCAQCRRGRPNLCPDKGGYGSRYAGGFAEQVVVREESCVVLPDGVPWQLAALSEPLACAVHGMDRLGSVLGADALVYGAGTIGMLMSALLMRGGASVSVVERAPARASVAQGWDLPCVSDAASYDNPDGWDIVVDATGVPAAIEEAVTQVRRGGTMLMMGVAPPSEAVSISPYRVNWHELTILGSMAIQHSFERAVALLPALDPRLESLVTHTVQLQDFGAAIDLVRNRDAMKVIITPPGADASPTAMTDDGE